MTREVGVHVFASKAFRCDFDTKGSLFLLFMFLLRF